MVEAKREIRIQELTWHASWHYLVRGGAFGGSLGELKDWFPPGFD